MASAEADMAAAVKVATTVLNSRKLSSYRESPYREYLLFNLDLLSYFLYSTLAVISFIYFNEHANLEQTRRTSPMCSVQLETLPVTIRLVHLELRSTRIVQLVNQRLV